MMCVFSNLMRIGYGVSLGVLFVAWAGAALAAEWSVEPSVSLREEYDSNIQLTTLPHDATWKTFLTPAITAACKTEADAILLGARLSSRHYSGDLDLTRNDQYYTLSGNAHSERNQWGLDASMTRDASITAHTSSGETTAQRDYITLSPSWVFLVDERNQFRLNYQYANANYLNAGGTSLTDYRNQSLSTSWQYQFDERNKFNVVLYGSGYETSTGSYKSDTTGIQGGLSRNFYETLSGSFLLGMRTTKTTRSGLECVGGDLWWDRIWSCDLYKVGIGGYGVWQMVSREETGTGSTLTASLEYKTETFDMGGSVSRDINPSGVGSLRESDSIKLTASNKLTPRVLVRLNFLAQSERDLGDTSSTSDRRYYKIEPKVNWRMTEWWTLDAGYSYASQKYRAAASAAKANVVFVNLKYSWPKIAVSR